MFDYDKNEGVTGFLQETTGKRKWGLILLSMVGVIMGIEGVSGKVEIEESAFGKTKAGDEVILFSLRNGSGIQVDLLNYGAMLIGVETPDREGQLENITLYLDSWEEYEKGHPLLGSVVGRFANRIGGGGFAISGRRFDLETVNSKTGVHLHGGKTGFQRQVWRAKRVNAKEGEGRKSGVAFTLISADGHEGYPGKVKAEVSYLLAEEAAELTIQYRATTTKPTHVNLTNHAYWNLGGAGSGDVLGHQLEIAADEMLEVDSRKVPTGRYLDLTGTAFDFREGRMIGERIEETDGGYDHCYVLSLSERRPLRRCARVYDPESGRIMEVATTQPGVQIYTANRLSDRLGGGGHSYGRFHGVCLETQHFPDAPNKPAFPSTLLEEGEEYFEETVFTFSVDER